MLEKDSLNWPPAYSIKRHPRSRRVKLRASLRDGLEFVVPLNFNERRIPGLLAEHRDWIEKQFAKIRQHPTADTSLPEKIILPVAKQEWNINYVQSNTALRLVAIGNGNITIYGDIQNQTGCKKLLTSWIRKIANVILPALLKTVSIHTGLSYNHVSIRDQKTRWGSCSHDKKISLNYRLMFLSPELIEYILVHELCHTVHMNHSARFWRLVEKFEPAWREKRRAIKNMDKVLPGWVV